MGLQQFVGRTVQKQRAGRLEHQRRAGKAERRPGRTAIDLSNLMRDVGLAGAGQRVQRGSRQEDCRAQIVEAVAIDIAQPHVAGGGQFHGTGRAGGRLSQHFSQRDHAVRNCACGDLAAEDQQRAACVANQEIRPPVAVQVAHGQ